MELVGIVGGLDLVAEGRRNISSSLSARSTFKSLRSITSRFSRSCFYFESFSSFFRLEILSVKTCSRSCSLSTPVDFNLFCTISCRSRKINLKLICSSPNSHVSLPISIVDTSYQWPGFAREFFLLNLSSNTKITLTFLKETVASPPPTPDSPALSEKWRSRQGIPRVYPLTRGICFFVINFFLISKT